MWTCLEAAVGIVGACLPNLRPLFKCSGGNFWSQIRSSRGSSKAHLNSNTTNTTHTSNTASTSETLTNETMVIAKPQLNTHVSDEGTQGIEVHRYSKYIGIEK